MSVIEGYRRKSGVVVKSESVNNSFLAGLEPCYRLHSLVKSTSCLSRTKVCWADIVIVLASACLDVLFVGVLPPVKR